MAALHVVVFIFLTVTLLGTTIGVTDENFRLVSSDNILLHVNFVLLVGGKASFSFHNHMLTNFRTCGPL